MVVVIDYGVCNVGSIENMLKKAGAGGVKVTSSPEDLDAADRLVLPGVGSFDSGIRSLETLGLKGKIIDFAASGRPLLGICLGMQLLGRRSEEGDLPGLGLVPMECQRFQSGPELKVPHMGWDQVWFDPRTSRLLEGLEPHQRYYFVHSYHAVVDSSAYGIMWCEYGDKFAAAVQNNNVYGCQFHPEKSHGYGMRLLKNFVEKC